MNEFSYRKTCRDHCDQAGQPLLPGLISTC
jgi:hypothetical protein